MLPCNAKHARWALALGAFLCLASTAISEEFEECTCDEIVDDFIRKRPSLSRFPAVPKPQEATKFIFFLHVPRTAGRSFNACFLQSGFPPSHRCAASYAAFRLEASAPRCQTIASHDDYSVTDFLPPGGGVISQFRDPVDRFISAYEFAIEVSARELGRKKPLNETLEGERINTRDVWPWMYLVPFFDMDLNYGMMEAREAYKRLTEQAEPPSWIPALEEKTGRLYYFHRLERRSKWPSALSREEVRDSLPLLDPYSNELIVSLEEFVEEPIAMDLINNGMTYQVLGISNNSYWPEAEKVRMCMETSASAELKLMDLAKKRVDSLLHISLTDHLKESVHSLAAALGLRMEGPTWRNEKNELRREHIEKTSHDLMNHVDKWKGDYSNATDLYITDLTLKAYRSMKASMFSVKTFNISRSTDAEYWQLWKIAEEKRKLYRELQNETLLRRKKADNDAIVPFPKMKNSEKSLLNDTLWSTFYKCDNRKKEANRNKRFRSLHNMVHPDERRIHFSKQARSAIPPETIEKIRKYNWLDQELYQYILEAYSKQINRQIKLGQLSKQLPKIKILSSKCKNPAKHGFRLRKKQRRAAAA